MRTLPGALRVQAPALLNQILGIPLVQWFIISKELGAKLFSSSVQPPRAAKASFGHRSAKPGVDEGALDLLGLRLAQVVKILRNLALEKTNRQAMASNALVMRFVTRGLASCNALAHTKCFVKDTMSVLDDLSVILQGTCLEIFGCLGMYIDLDMMPEGSEFVKDYLREAIFSKAMGLAAAD